MQVIVRFHPPDHLDVRFDSSEQNIPVRFKEFQQVETAPDVEMYDGSYEIIPKVDEQMIPTAQKFMTRDVTIKKIPYFDVGNTAGGSTVYIANEV